MTNYTIEMLKKEESRLADCIDVLNAMGAEESTPEKLGLTTARDSVRETLEILEGKVSNTSNVDLNAFKWERAIGKVVRTMAEESEDKASNSPTVDLNVYRWGETRGATKKATKKEIESEEVITGILLSLDSRLRKLEGTIDQ